MEKERNRHKDVFYISKNYYIVVRMKDYIYCKLLFKREKKMLKKKMHRGLKRLKLKRQKTKIDWLLKYREEKLKY